MKSKISTFIIECLRTDVTDNLDIFSEDAESDDTEMTPEKWEKILRIMRMSEQLEDVSFLKGIE